MKYTGIKATQAEIKRFKKQLKKAQNTPIMALTSNAAFSGNDFASIAWRTLNKSVHIAALKHGLPEIPGFYGIDLQKGEFLKWGGKVK